LASVKTSVVVAPSAIVPVPKVFATVGAPAVTTRQLAPTPLVRLARALMFAAPFVNAAGLPTQLALVCAARFVTPVTVIVHVGAPALIDTLENAIESGVPCVTTTTGAGAAPHPAPNVTVGAAEVKRRLDGSASVNAIPACAGLDPVFVRVKTSVVLALSAIETAPNAFVSVGCAAFTTRHWSAEAFAALVAVTLAERFVNAAGFVAQLALVCVAAFVTPATVTVQLTVPEDIAIPVSPESTRVPPV